MQPNEPSPDPLDSVFLTATVQRLAVRWRKVAARIEPYSGSAATAYRQAVQDIEEVGGTHPQALGVLRAFRDAIVEALRHRDRSG